MRNRLILVALAALCATSLAAAKIPPEWITAQKQPYWDVSRAALELVTLDLATDAKCGFTGGKYVLNAGRDYTAVACTARDGAYLWAKTCKAGAQEVKFTKRVYLPGTPLALEGSLVSLKNRRMTYMEIDVNGSAVLRTGVSVHKKKGKTTGFKLGWNVITVRAAKGRTGPCNKSTPDTGVYGTLRATFGADVSATIPPPVRATSSSFQIPITVKNNGPSAAMVGNVAFTVGTDKLVTVPDNPNRGILLLLGGAPLTECANFATGGFSASCALGVLKAGETRTVTAIYAYKDPGGNFSDKYKISWGAAGGLPDPKPANDGGSRDQFVCRPGPCGPP